MNALSEAPADLQPPAATLEDLVRTHQQTVWRLLRYLGADPAEADDLTQETFLAVARGRFEQRSPAETTAYLRTVARNQLLLLRRKQARHAPAAPLEAAEAVWAESVEPTGWQAFADTLRDCVGKLEGRASTAIDLCYREGLSRQAIAERLDMKSDGVKTLLRRTRATLRECVERSTRGELEQS